MGFPIGYRHKAVRRVILMKINLNDNQMEKARKLRLLVSSGKNEPSALLLLFSLARDSIVINQCDAVASKLIGWSGHEVAAAT